MILSDVVYEKFKALMEAIPSWANLADSQFVKHLAIFVGWSVEDASYKLDRARQEAFIDTALNRSSILAHGEGMEYLPIKAIPSEGKILIENQGDVSFTLLAGRQFESDAQVTYTLQDTVIVPSKSSVYANVKQYKTEDILFTVDVQKAFYEILLDKEKSRQLSSFKVFVSEDGITEEEWEYRRLLTNSYSDSKIYDEFYHFTDQTGIRFGNGDFGKIPLLGSVIRVQAQLTDGNTILLTKQSLWPETEILDDTGNIASYNITVYETIQNGEDQEAAESVRKNLHYASIYNERLVWENDYKYFLKRYMPDLVWIKVWGEEESEKLWGYNVSNINRIYICAYSPDRTVADTKTKALEVFRNNVNYLCRNYDWYDPVHVTFSLAITGKILQDAVIADVQTAIKNILTKYYGKDSLERRDNVRLHELYEAIYSTGYFDKTTGAWFEITVTGALSPDKIYKMLSIDMTATTITLEYLR